MAKKATTILELFYELQDEWKPLNERRVSHMKRILRIRKTVLGCGIIRNKRKTVGTIYLKMPEKQIDWMMNNEESIAYRIKPENFHLGSLPREKVKALVDAIGNDGPFFEGTSCVAGRRVTLLSRPDGLCISVEGIPGYILLEYLNGNPVRLSDDWETERYPLNIAQVPMLADILEAGFDED